ncbi:uncharacterized protein LOC119577866 [Penaeus monodon]|uniref:uncharacterized protein LOC119577866 n=1 Tax=Penaeus monodon TaxID=6687 RepID=UPI0018A6EC09|nr:uncharacterized protein LOC119577866 [Penaeus monodon]
MNHFVRALPLLCRDRKENCATLCLSRRSSNTWSTGTVMDRFVFPPSDGDKTPPVCVYVNVHSLFRREVRRNHGMLQVLMQRRKNRYAKLRTWNNSLWRGRVRKVNSPLN